MKMEVRQGHLAERGGDRGAWYRIEEKMIITEEKIDIQIGKFLKVDGRKTVQGPLG